MIRARPVTFAGGLLSSCPKTVRKSKKNGGAGGGGDDVRDSVG